MRPPRRSTAVALLAVAVTASVAACGSEEVGRRALRGGSGGPPEALTASPAGDVLVATGEHVLRSSDGGRTFDTVAHRG